MNGTPTTTSAGFGPVLDSDKSAVGVCSVAPPSVAVLLLSVGSVGALELMVAVVVMFAPAVAIVTGIVTDPSD